MMKTKILFLLICSATIYSGNGQSTVPNSGFESWSSKIVYDEPNSWGTLNAATFIGGAGAAVSKNSDKRSGTWAAKLDTKVMTNNPAPGTLPDTLPGTAFTGSFDLATTSAVLGVPFSARLSELKFWYKYSPQGGDSAGALVTLSYWNAAVGARMTVATGALLVGGANSSYVEGVVTLAEVLPNAPDTILIVFAASGGATATPGSSLKVDDISVTLATGITEPFLAHNGISVYPNPASEQFIVVSEITAAYVLEFELFDISGRSVKKESLDNRLNPMDSSIMPKGLYFYRVTGGDGKFLSSGKLCIQ